MRFEVHVVALADDGTPFWGYIHEEVVVPSEDEEGNALRLTAQVLERVDEAREAIVKQSGVDLDHLAAEERRRETER